MSTLSEYVQNITPPRLKQNELGRNVVESLISIPNSIVMEMKEEISHTQQQQFDNIPHESNEIVLNESRFQRYQIDTDSTITTRCVNRYSDYSLMGNLEGIKKQLSYAGYDNVYILSQNLGGTDTYPMYVEQKGTGPFGEDSLYPPSSEYFSQFIVFISVLTTHNVSDWTNNISWDDDIVWDQKGLYWDGVHSDLVSFNDLTEIKSIIRQFKPIDWICREIILMPGNYLNVMLNLIETNEVQLLLSDSNCERWNPIL